MRVCMLENLCSNCKVLLKNNLILQFANSRDGNLDHVAIVQELLRLHKGTDAGRSPGHDGRESRDRGACSEGPTY